MQRHGRALPVATSTRRRNDACPRIGQATRAAFVLILSLVILAVIAGLYFLYPGHDGAPSGRQPLAVFCAASQKDVMESICREYEEDYGVPIRLQFGASQSMLANAEVSRSGDLFLPADDSYLDSAHRKELIAESIPLARMRAVLAVPKGNPRDIRSLDDLLKKDVRLAQANPDAAAIGALTRRALDERDRWESLAEHTKVFKGTVNEVANDVKVGAVDAGIVWDAVLTSYPTLEAVRLAELEGITARIAIAVLRSARDPAAALHFARYLAARDKGQLHYKRLGFEPENGDAWEETPEITLYAGAMLRPAIEATLERFQQREGARVKTVYNGCGILVAQMKAIMKDQMKSRSLPDAYFACDRQFMHQVRELFPDAQDVSTNQLVILVPKGNPREIRSLKDLARPGLRVGIGHEKQCAMGWLTQETFKKTRLREAVMPNVKVQSPTGDMLVNQMRAGSLDAAVAYLSNAVGSGEFLDAIRIEDIPCAVAVQPFAIAKDSRHQQLAGRLLDALRSGESEKEFMKNGFQWGNRNDAP